MMIPLEQDWIYFFKNWRSAKDPCSPPSGPRDGFLQRGCRGAIIRCREWCEGVTWVYMGIYGYIMVYNIYNAISQDQGPQSVSASHLSTRCRIWPCTLPAPAVASLSWICPGTPWVGTPRSSGPFLCQPGVASICAQVPMPSSSWGGIFV